MNDWPEFVNDKKLYISNHHGWSLFQIKKFKHSKLFLEQKY
jgi:hypothetical protein